MATQNSLQDCYFYFYSSCTKGNECPFRHCELALGTETVCSLWKEGRCFRSNCKFRHMESRIKRSMIPCYWENQPGGCRKPHCVFLHRKLRNGAQVIKDNPGLILPTSDGKTSPKLPDSNESSDSSKVTLVDNAFDNDVSPDPSLTPVPPLVLSFDEGEESDTESVTNTPVKQSDKKAALTRNNMSIKAADLLEEKDFGIKTLEQIRMERIHKESDSFYGAVYTSTPLDAPGLIDQHYPPKGDFIALPKDSTLDKSLPAPVVEPKLSGVDEESDLRGRLSNRRNTLNKVNQLKRIANFKKQNTNQVEVVSKKLDFKIKTLEEIRKEKENKLSKIESSSNNSLDLLPSLEKKSNTKENTSKRLKINRKTSVPTILKQDASTPNLTDVNASHLVSNGLKKEVLKSSAELREIPPVGNSLNSPGKRKNGDDSISSVAKIIKLAPQCTSNDKAEQAKVMSACSEETNENHFLSLPSPAGEPCNKSSHSHVLTPLDIKQDEVIASQSSITDTEMNDTIISTSTSSSPKSKRMLDESAIKASAENEHIFEIKTSDKILNSLTSSSITKSDQANVNGIRKEKDSLIDRSMSVDDALDEFLGDEGMNIDEMDTAPNDDILLQIEEFLES